MWNSDCKIHGPRDTMVTGFPELHYGLEPLKAFMEELIEVPSLRSKIAYA